MERGVFTISIDYEYAWGYADYFLSEEQKERIKREVGITRRLTELFEEYEIPVTWAVVGHLLEPHEAFSKDPLWYDGEKLIDGIAHSLVGHEIGSHSYAHIVYGSSKRELVERDLENVLRVHRQNNLSTKSFVFPGNEEGFHVLVRKAGFESYRGNCSFWFEKLPGVFGRILRFKSQFLPVAPISLPTRHESGFINIPGNMLLMARNGLRSLIPADITVARAKSGINRAVRKRKIFHLWFHPSNFSYKTDTQFEILEKILQYANSLRNEGKLEVLTMGEIAKRVVNQ